MANSKTATIIFKGEDQISPALKGATASVAGLSQSFAGVENASNKTAAQIKSELTKAIASVTNELANLSRQKLTPEVQLKQSNALQQLNELKSKLNEIDKLVVKPQVDNESLLKSQLQAQALGQLVGKLNELKSASLDAFGEFKKAQRSAAGQATDITGLSTAVRGLSSELKNQVSSTELLDNASKVAQKGYRDTADNINVLRATEKLAIATNTDFNTALEATTDILKAYNLPSSDADKVTAQLAATARLAGTSVGELAPQIGRIATTAASAGVGINDLLGFLGNASKKSGDAKGNISALNKVINDLSTGELAKKGQEVGISFNEAAIKTGGLNELFKELRDQGITTAEGLQKLGFNSKEAAAIVPSLATGITKIKDAQADLNKQYETQVDPKKSAENQLQNSLVELGKTIAPIANQVVLATRSMIVAFTQLPEPIQATLATLLGTGGLIVSIGLLGGSIIEGVKIVGLAVEAIKAFDIALAATNATSKAVAISNAIVGTSIAATGTAASGATIGVGALTVSLGTLALAAAAVAIPLAAIAGALVLKGKIDDLRAYNEATDTAAVSGQQLANSTSGVISKLESLQATRKKGIALTEDQVKKEQGYLKIAQDQIEAEKKGLAEVEAIKTTDSGQEQAKQADIASRKKIIELAEKEKKELESLIVSGQTKSKSNAAIARSEKDVEAAVKSRIEAEKRTNETQAKTRSRDFDTTAKSDAKQFENQSRADKQAFEKVLNADKKAFDADQKADKEKFEKNLQGDQRRFNAEEKENDSRYQRSKQDIERAFNAEQQAAKEAFDRKQQQASKAFDDKQSAEKGKADEQFAQRKTEIERKLQLDGAKTPEDKSKLEAEFKAADEKSAKEKIAFAQLTADQEAFAKKQQTDKLAFEEAQKLAAQNFEKQQQTDKLAFDDQIKLKDQAYEQQKEVAKLAFEDTLKAKRDALEVGQTKLKEDFEAAQTLKKQDFEDQERKKKEDFEAAQNLKKQDFEEAERLKKQTFEDNLKLLEAQFKADERAKDIATAQQVAAIKSSAGNAASTVADLASSAVGIATPRASGGRFDSGQQLLVGERGPELITFGNAGYVANATSTKQILQSNSSSNVDTARMEGLLNKIAGKLDRPNNSYQITTSKDPLSAAMELERERVRNLAVFS